MVEKEIEQALALAVRQLELEGQLKLDSVPILVQRTPPNVSGDYATNLALVLAKPAKYEPLELAEKIADRIRAKNSAYDWLAKVEVAPPGFINFHCQQESILNTIAEVLKRGEQFGAASLPEEDKKRILVEYVSANPTGPLHIGHGRAAAIGSALVNVMNFVGYDADGEFYVNDSGRQMNILTASFLLRHIRPPESPLPEGFYQGKYFTDLLTDLARQWKGPVVLPLDELESLLEESSLPKEERLDKTIELLEDFSNDLFQLAKQIVLTRMIELIKRDLEHFGVQHTSWYYESQTEDKIEAITKDLTSRNLLYNKQGAVWFRSSRFGDDKDRVFQRSNNQLTYFAYDIGYHNDKYLRTPGYDRLIDILGADHHGYMNRIRASMEALGHSPKSFDILLVQLVFLINEDKDRLSMSTRADKFISLAELVEEFGVDLVRFFLLMHRADQPLNFDMALARSQTKDNPVYYVQYACARIASLFSEKRYWQQAHLNKEGEKWLEDEGLPRLNLLIERQELTLATKLSEFPQLLVDIAANCDIHRLTLYLCELAGEFHSYYNRVRILGEEAEAPRLCLCAAIRQTLANGLRLLGVEAPTKM